MQVVCPVGWQASQRGGSVYAVPGSLGAMNAERLYDWELASEEVVVGELGTVWELSLPERILQY
jgi:hypothetical protein